MFGAGFGFALGSMTLFTSALLTGGSARGCRSRCSPHPGSAWARGCSPDGCAGASTGRTRRLRGGVRLPLRPGHEPVVLAVHDRAGTALSFQAGAPLGENLHRFLLFSIDDLARLGPVRALVLGVGVAVLGRPALSALRRAARLAVFANPEPPSGEVGPPPPLVTRSRESGVDEYTAAGRSRVR